MIANPFNIIHDMKQCADGEKVVFNPATAVVEVIKELDRMASLASENLNRAMNALITLDEEEMPMLHPRIMNIHISSPKSSWFAINTMILTVTEELWITAVFKLEKIAPVILLMGVILVMFCKKQKITKFGEIIVLV